MLAFLRWQLLQVFLDNTGVSLAVEVQRRIIEKVTAVFMPPTPAICTMLKAGFGDN
jgi:hypothetical protein